MRDLNALFGQAFDEPDSYLGAPPDDDWLRSLLDGDRVVALVAESDGRLVGGLVGYVLPKFEQARRELYIYDLAVDADHRRRGIATGLIAALQDLAEALGVWVIYVQADAPDRAAVALYDGLGSRASVLHFDIPVRRPRG